METSIFRSLYETVSEFARSFNASSDIPNIPNVKVPEFLKVKPNKRCITVYYRPDKYDLMSNYVQNNLKFYRDDGTKGCIYKTESGDVTVTLYSNATNTLHIQGSSASSWYKTFMNDMANACDMDDVSDLESNPFASQQQLSSARSASNTNVPTTCDMTCDNDSITELKLLASSTPNAGNTITVREKYSVIEQISEIEKSKECNHCDSAAIIRELSATVINLSSEVENLRAQLKEAQNCKSETKPKSGTQGTKLIDIKHFTEFVPRHQNSVTNTTTLRAPTCSTNENLHDHKEPVRSQQSAGQSKLGKKMDNKRKSVSNEHNDQTLIIGSSILKNIHTRGLNGKVTVKTMRGAQLSRIRQEIEKLDVTKYGNIIIQAGGNDAANERNIDSVKDDLVRIVCDVKSRSPSTTVHISEVTPRYDADVWEVNNTAWEVCHEYDAKFIETNFHVNPYHYEWDHIHLSFKGTSKLLKIYNSYMPILKKHGDTTLCYNCGERGHNARKCRHGGQIECYHCGHLGHKYKFCEY